MLYIICIYILVDGFLINVEGHNVTFNISSGDSCEVTNDTLEVKLGDDIQFGYYSTYVIPDGNCSVISASGSTITPLRLKRDLVNPSNISKSYFSTLNNITKDHIGNWTCSFKKLDNNGQNQNQIQEKIIDCRVFLKNATSPIDAKPIDGTLYYYICAGTLVAFIIFAQTGVIIYFKTKAQRVARMSKGLSETREESDTDKNVYVTTSDKSKKWKRTKKSLDDNVIYESLEEAINMGPPTPPIENIPTLKSTVSTTPGGAESKPRGTPQGTPRGTLKKDFERNHIMRPPLPLPKDLTNEENSLDRRRDPSKRPPLPIPTDLTDAPIKGVNSSPAGLQIKPKPLVPDPKHGPVSHVKSELVNIFKNKNGALPLEKKKAPFSETHVPSKPTGPEPAKEIKPAAPGPSGIGNKHKPSTRKPTPAMVSELDIIFKNKNAPQLKHSAAVPPTNSVQSVIPKKPVPEVKVLPNKKPIPTAPRKPLVLPGLRPEMQPPPQKPRTPAGSKRPLPAPPPENEVISRTRPPAPAVGEEPIYEEYDEEEYEPCNVDLPPEQEFYSPDYKNDSSDEDWTYEPLPQYNIYST